MDIINKAGSGFFAIIVLALSLPFATFAQKGSNQNILSIERNPIDNTPVSITFSPTSVLHEGTEQEVFMDYLGAKENAMHLVNTTTTKNGLVVKRYAQFYKGIKIAFSSYTATIKDGLIKFLTGNYYNVTKDIDDHPAVAESDAFRNALGFVKADKYMWQSPAAEQHIKAQYRKDTTYLPKGKLVWIEDHYPASKDKSLHLAWSFDIYAVQPVSRQEVFIDAQNGKVLFSNSVLKHTAASARSKYSGVVPFQTADTGLAYTLYDSTRGNGIYTQDLNNGTDATTVTDFTSPTNTWPSATSDTVAIDAHWAAEMVYDYWLTQQGRHSWDDLDGILQQYVHYDVAYNNAFWDGTEMMYGDGSGSGSGGFDPLTCLDVVGHEIGHGVCQSTAGLIYESEPGAMNEGLSDCWGATIEHWADPHEIDAVPKSTWAIGEEMRAGNPIRRMDFPKLKGQPDTYGGINWFSLTSCVPDGSNDDCGVHQNSGVFNKWYYLITNGGSGTNDNSNAYSVTGQGWVIAPNILYQTELVLSSTASFALFRTTSINVATLLYGACSAQVQAVTNAWYAVGVGAAFVSTVAAVTGPAVVCAGQTTTLNDVTPGGAWTSANTSVATVGTGSPIVTGVAAGTSIITYATGPACYSVRTVTVNPLPGAISGTTNVCVGATTALTDGGIGTWASSITSVATVGTSGIVTGVASGTTVITYTLGTGCYATAVVTTSITPGIITGTASVCEGAATLLGDAPGGGGWASSNTAVATVTGGLVTGVTAGTSTITYLLGSGCTATRIVTVNTTPSAITGTPAVCTGLTTPLGDIPGGGGWVSSNAAVATVIAGTGLVSGVTAGTTTISYTLATGCMASTIVTVNQTPSAITGTTTLCTGGTSLLGDAFPGGGWTSSDPAVAPIVGGTGLVTGVGVGTSTIVYTLAGCTNSTVVTVNLTPVAITGATTLCTGLTTSLSDATPGGGWSSSNTGTATAVAGTVGGVSAGSAIISYTLVGCTSTTPVIVNIPPGPVTGTTVICSGDISTLGNAVPGGIWSSTDPAVATVAAGSGDVSAITVGTSSIVYTMGAGCTASATVTVLLGAAAITGTTFACIGGTTSLSDGTFGGAWSSSTTSVATVVPGTGIVSGVSTGTSTITYLLGSGCSATTVVSVSPAVAAAITGTAPVCVGQTISLSDATPAGTWSSGSASVAMVGSGTGVVTGVAAGVATISYTVTNSCGTAVATTVVAVNPLPAVAPVSGTLTVCSGATTALSDATPSGVWSSGGTGIATITSTGVAGGVSAGFASISYTVTSGAGCVNSAITILTVSTPLMPAVSPSGPITFCTGAYTSLNATAGSGYTYQWLNGASLIPGATSSSLTVTTAMGTGNYSVVLNSGSGCVATSAPVAITVNPSPVIVPAVSISASPGTSLCAVSSPVTFTPVPVNGGVSPSYQWFVNGTAMGGGGSYTYSPANGDAIMCQITSSDICAFPATAANTTTMTIVMPQVPAVSIAASPGDTVCNGHLVTIVPLAVFGGSSPSYSWTRNSVAAHLGSSYTFVPANGDIIVCTMTSNYFCVSSGTAASSPLMVHVAPLNTNAVVISATATSIIAGQPDTFVAAAPFGGVSPSYQWYINLVAVPGATSGIFITGGLVMGDLVTCQLTTSDPCTSPTSVTSNGIKMNVTPNGVGTVATSGGFTLTPNPNTGTFRISGTVKDLTGDPMSVRIANMLGQIIYTGSLQPYHGIVDGQISLGETVASGLYLVNITSGEEHVVFQIVVKK